MEDFYCVEKRVFFISKLDEALCHITHYQNKKCLCIVNKGNFLANGADLLLKDEKLNYQNNHGSILFF